ncbi:hypothetical protein NKG05_14375 [Oerskovia sp. M15]
MTVGLVSWNALVQAGQIERHMVIIGAFVAVVPLVLAFLSLQRFWRSGLAAGPSSEPAAPADRASRPVGSRPCALRARSRRP